MDGLSRGGWPSAGLVPPRRTLASARPRSSSAARTNRTPFARDDAAGRLPVLIDGREAFVYQIRPGRRHPSLLADAQPEREEHARPEDRAHPHHRSFWFADTVRLEGGERDISFYNASLQRDQDRGRDYAPPFNDHIRLVGFTEARSQGRPGRDRGRTLWEMDGRPVLEEKRRIVVHAWARASTFSTSPYAHDRGRRGRLRQRRRPLRLAVSPAR